MTLEGPFQYQIEFDHDHIKRVVGPNEAVNFAGKVAKAKHGKLYVVSEGHEILYVGKTSQPIRQRLNYGFKATGNKGYHGYPWREGRTRADLDIWVESDGGIGGDKFLETVEAEVAFLVRQELDQWPSGQTEIHFHRSDQLHRELAHNIVRICSEKRCQTA